MDSFVRVFLSHRYLRADKAVRAPLVAATPRCAFAFFLSTETFGVRGCG